MSSGCTLAADRALQVKRSVFPSPPRPCGSADVSRLRGSGHTLEAGKAARVVGAQTPLTLTIHWAIDSQDSAAVGLAAVIYCSEWVCSTIRRGEGIRGEDQRTRVQASPGDTGLTNPFSDELRRVRRFLSGKLPCAPVQGWGQSFAAFAERVPNSRLPEGGGCRVPTTLSVQRVSAQCQLREW